MPNINITDRDLTTASSSVDNSYAVFIPGITGWDSGITEAVEYTSLAAFQSAMGSAPETFGTDQLNDKSYICACELLGIGLPVVYKVISGVAKQKSVQQTDEYDAFVSGTSKLSHLPVNVTAGTTNLATDTNITFRNSNGAVITMANTVTITVSSGLVITVSDSAAEPYTGADIASITYNYNTTIPSGDVDLSTATVADICGAISSTDFSEINDRGLFDVSFVTTGGYPTIYVSGVSTTSSLASKLTAVTAARGDCFALIDVDEDITINKLEDLPESIKINDADAFVVTPWVNYSTAFSGLAGASEMLPGSFDFLVAFAKSIRTNNSWFATAGVRRGSSGINGVSNIVTNAEADALQPINGTSVNAITYIRPYGYVIWGNRTLNTNTGLVANSFINIRQLVHEIKRQLYKVARGLMFEPNDDILWVNFKNQITPLLERMRSGQGISSYRLVRVANSTRATLTARIIITPIEAVENFELTVELIDDEAVITE